MKKFMITLLALMPLVVFAQFSSGFYRVQNAKTERFLRVVDNRASALPAQSDVDVSALKLVRGFDEKVCYDPNTICYIEQVSTYQYNIVVGNLNFYSSTGTYLDFDPDVPSTAPSGSYIISGKGTVSGVTISKKLYDTNYKPDTIADLRTTGTKDYQYWYVRPVNDNYFIGVKPDFSASLDGAEDLYYTTCFAFYPFTLGSSMKAYYPIEISGEYVKVKEANQTMPATSAMIVECTSSIPKDNKVMPITSAPSVSGNMLTGVYFCNDVSGSHRNVTEYKASTMRVLGKAADGRLAFVTDSKLKYIPANKAYLTVPAGTPSTLYVVTDIPSGIEQVKADVKLIRKGVYTLSGQFISETTDGLSKGVYIVNGQKMVVK